MAEQCEKCASRAVWYEVHDNAVLMCCLCGMSRWVLKESPDGTISRRGKVELPRRGSKLFRVLDLVFQGKRVTTQSVSAATGDSSGKVGTQLSVLHAKGLIERLVNGKGRAGGSEWGPSAEAKELLK